MVSYWQVSIPHIMTTLSIIVLGAIIGLFLYAKGRPDTFRLERRIVVAAPAEKIFPLVNDFHSWVNWSPWEGLDPNMKRTYEGAQSGVGTKYAWVGEGKVGAGSMEITNSTPSSAILIKLDFEKPFEAHNITTFTFAPGEGGTEVVWSMEGHLNLMMKIMHIFMNMEKLVGGDFEKGLMSLRALAEK